MCEFKREERYVVLKLKHMTDADRLALQDIVLNSMGFAAYQTECVCVESDWPIHEQTLIAVQRLVEGRPQQVEEMHKQIDEQQKQIAELKHHVNALRKSINAFKECGITFNMFAMFEQAAKTPPQSLAEPDAMVIESLATDESLAYWCDDWDCYAIEVSHLQKIIKELLKQGEE